MSQPVNLRVRPASAGDAVILSQFMRRTFQDQYARDNTADNLQRYLHQSYSPSIQLKEIESGRHPVLLGEVDGVLAAFAQLRLGGPRPPCVEQSRCIELWRFYVDRPWQGRGVSWNLMSQVKREAGERGAPALWLGVWERNPRAIAFYRKNGFGQIGTQLSSVGADPQTDLVLYCPL